MHDPNKPNEPNEPFEEVLLGRNAEPFPTLSGIEEQLKKYRPRLPQLDIEAIAGVGPSEIVSSPIYVNSTTAIGTPSRSHLFGTIAASWACGVVVGAACIFFWMSSQKPTVQNSAVTARDRSEQSVAPEGPSVVLRQTGSQAPSDVQWTINDELHFDRSDEPLKIGMSLRSLGKLVRSSEPVRGADRQRSIANGIETRLELLDIQFTPPTPLTKAELMKELLEDSLQTIY